MVSQDPSDKEPLQDTDTSASSSRTAVHETGLLLFPAFDRTDSLQE